jgi:hypothetical protein
MAANQPARFGVAETTDEFMERRRREVAQREADEAAGRTDWVTSTSTGENLHAPRPADLVALGARTVAGPRSERVVTPVRSLSGSSQSSNQEPGIRYGALYAPPSNDLPSLRREQADFGQVTQDIDKQNSWLAIPALSPGALVLGLEGAAALGGRAVGSRALAGPLDFVEREAWQANRRAGQALTEQAKAMIRRAARLKLARANGISTSEMQAEVHHFDPLEWAHVKPNADPNRLANLGALRGEAHDIASKAWTEFRNSLNGRWPTQAELFEAKLRIQRMIEPYIRRAGVPRSNTPPRQGGPI